MNRPIEKDYRSSCCTSESCTKVFNFKQYIEDLNTYIDKLEDDLESLKMADYYKEGRITNPIEEQFTSKDVMERLQRYSDSINKWRLSEATGSPPPTSRLPT